MKPHVKSGDFLITFFGIWQSGTPQRRSFFHFLTQKFTNWRKFTMEKNNTTSCLERKLVNKLCYWDRPIGRIADRAITARSLAGRRPLVDRARSSRAAYARSSRGASRSRFPHQSAADAGPVLSYYDLSSWLMHLCASEGGPT